MAEIAANRKRAWRESDRSTLSVLIDLVDDRVEMLPNLRLVYKLTTVGLVDAFLDFSS